MLWLHIAVGVFIGLGSFALAVAGYIEAYSRWEKSRWKRLAWWTAYKKSWVGVSRRIG
jgi:hypothetical protein